MEAFLLYMFKSALCLTILYVFVKAFLSKETFFRFNRIVLLAGIVISLILPLVSFTTQETSFIQTPFVELEDILTVNQPQANELVTLSLPQTEIPYTDENNAIDWSLAVLIAYLAGLVINMAILLYSFFAMYKVIADGWKMQYGKYRLVLLLEKVCPFSWGKYIVMSEWDYMNNPDEILAHEISHIQHRHTVDLIIIELILLFQWFNPAMWLLKREMKDIHEYQADMSVLETGIDATKYQLLLVKKAVGTSSYTLANSFNHSKIKKRITMMLKQKSNNWAKLKLVFLLPLATLAMFAFAKPELSTNEDTALANKVKEINGSSLSISAEKSEVEADTQQKTQKQMSNEIIKSFNAIVEEEGFKNPERIGVASEGKFLLFMIGNMQDKTYAIMPEYYLKSDTEKKTQQKKIYYFVVDGEKNTWSKFVKKYPTGKTFFERSKIKPEDGEVMQIYGITNDGLKTPAWFLVVPK